MKKLSRLFLVIFSIIVLVLGVIINLLVVNWIEFDTVFSVIEDALTQDPTNKIILAITEFCMLFALICIFAGSSNKKEKRDKRDVLMQNDSGKLMISRDTIESLVNTVVRDFQGVKESTTRIGLDKENNISVLVNLTVTKNVIIKEMTVNMQNRIKEAIKKTSDLEVNEVSVRIKNIVDQEIEE